MIDHGRRRYGDLEWDVEFEKKMVKVSQNPYALGRSVDFCFDVSQELTSAWPGFKRITIRPMIDPRVKRAGCRLRFGNGTLSQRIGCKLSMEHLRSMSLYPLILEHMCIFRIGRIPESKKVGATSRLARYSIFVPLRSRNCYCDRIGFVPFCCSCLSHLERNHKGLGNGQQV